MNYIIDRKAGYKVELLGYQMDGKKRIYGVDTNVELDSWNNKNGQNMEWVCTSFDVWK